MPPWRSGCEGGGPAARAGSRTRGSDGCFEDTVRGAGGGGRARCRGALDGLRVAHEAWPRVGAASPHAAHAPRDRPRVRSAGRGADIVNQVDRTARRRAGRPPGRSRTSGVTSRLSLPPPHRSRPPPLPLPLLLHRHPPLPLPLPLHCRRHRRRPPQRLPRPCLLPRPRYRPRRPHPRPRHRPRRQLRHPPRRRSPSSPSASRLLPHRRSRGCRRPARIGRAARAAMPLDRGPPPLAPRPCTAGGADCRSRSS
jgi:hypothetical protein